MQTTKDDLRPVLLSRTDLAERLQVSVATVDNLIARGEIETVKFGGGRSGTVRITTAAFDEFIAKNTRPARA